MAVQHLVSRRRLGAVLAASALAACAGAGAGAPSAAGSSGPARAAPPAGKFAPDAAPAAKYGPDPGRKCDAPLLDDVLGYLREAAKNAGRPAAQPDGRLCAVAESFLEWPAGKAPRPDVLAFTSHWFGLPGTVGTPIVAEFDLPDTPEGRSDLAQRVAQSSAGTAALNAVNPLIGMAVHKQRRGRYDVRTKVSVVVLDAPLELQPFPRTLARGERATLSGKLLGGASKPRVYVADPAGKVASAEPESGESFEVPVECGEKPGTIRVEIRGEVNGGTALLASFPVWCAESPPTAVAIEAEPWPTDPTAVRQKVLEEVNAQRAAAGVPPLKWDEAVARVAQGISEDLAARGGSPGGASLTERLKQEGIGSPLVLQSAAVERTPERAHERIATSARDRATLLNPDANSAGVGVFSTTDSSGAPLVYVTEILLKELPPVDVAAVRDQLRAAVARKRRDARTNPLTPDPTLDEVAERFAKALAEAGGTLPKEKASELTAPLNKTFKSVTMISGAKQEPLDFAEEPQTTAPGKVLGVGVAQGRHPVLGRNAVYVTIMVGTPRAGAATPPKKKATGKK